jgi:hypothetical protein
MSVHPSSTHPSDLRRTDSNRLEYAQQVRCNGTVLLLIMNSAWCRNQRKGLAAAVRYKVYSSELQPKSCNQHGAHGFSPRPGANKTEVPTVERRNCYRHRVSIRLRTMSVHPFVDACIRPTRDELTPVGLTTLNK